MTVVCDTFSQFDTLLHLLLIMINSRRGAVLNIDFLSDSEEQQAENQIKGFSQNNIAENDKKSTIIIPKFHHKLSSNHLVRHVFSNQVYQDDDQYQLQPYTPSKQKAAIRNVQRQSKRQNINIIQEKEHDNEEQTKSNSQNLKNQVQKNSQNIFIQDEANDEKKYSQEQQNEIRGVLTSRTINKIQISSSSENQSQSNKDEQLSDHQQSDNNYIDPLQLMNKGNTEYGKQFLRSFCSLEIQKSKTIKLTIIRDCSGFNMLWPNYHIYFSNKCNPLMAAKKMKGCISSNFYITTDIDIQDVKHPGFLAKLRSNSNQNIYNVYSPGINPTTQKTNNKKIRQIIATIKLLPMDETKKPRQILIFILKQKVNYLDLNGVKFNKEVSLDVLYQHQQNSKKIHFFKNRTPTYHQQLQGYILNFKGRAVFPSVKNVIFQDPQTQQQVLVVGKMKENEFRMDVSYPMRPDVSLCVALANFDSKFTGY